MRHEDKEDEVDESSTGSKGKFPETPEPEEVPKMPAQQYQRLDNNSAGTLQGSHFVGLCLWIIKTLHFWLKLTSLLISHPSRQRAAVSQLWLYFNLFNLVRPLFVLSATVKFLRSQGSGQKTSQRSPAKSRKTSRCRCNQFLFAGWADAAWFTGISSKIVSGSAFQRVHRTIDHLKFHPLLSGFCFNPCFKTPSHSGFDTTTCYVHAHAIICEKEEMGWEPSFQLQNVRGTIVDHGWPWFHGSYINMVETTI